MTTGTAKRLTLVSIVLVVFSVIPGAVSAATREVSITDSSFVPFETSINAGDEVVWTNTGSMQHTATDDGHTLFDSGLLNPGQTFRHVFPTAGRFGFHCDLHGFTGVIVVGDGTVTTTSTSTTSTSTTSTTQPTTTVVVTGAAFYSNGRSVETGPSGVRVSVFATRAEPGFSYRLVSGRGTDQQPCSADVEAVNDAPRFANDQGVIAQTAGTLDRPAGQWQICFLAAGQVVTGAASFTVTG